MKFEGMAWIWEEKGEPENLRLIQRTYATPEMGEVLVANEAVALNPVDWKCLEWNHPAWSSGHTPGVDGAGRIVAVGEGVTLSIGTRVAYHQDIARDGSFATHTLLPAKAAMAVPDALNASVAASMPCPGLTAWQALKKLPFVENRDVLVIGGGGSAALYCIQLAIQRGFRVWTTAAPRHHTRLLELGVIGAFDYRSPTWREDLSRALGVRKLFAAIDTVNEAHAQSLSPLIGYNGHIICIQDRLSRAIAPPFTTAISQHEVALNAIYSHGTEWDWTELRKYGTTMLNQLSAGDLETPHLVSFAFDELPQALHSLKGGSESGKLVSTLPRV